VLVTLPVIALTYSYFCILAVLHTVNKQ
jgi:hypothetical protein